MTGRHARLAALGLERFADPIGFTAKGQPIYPVGGGSEPTPEPTPTPTPPVPTPPAPPAQVTMTQEALNALMAKEKDQGARKLLADSLGFDSLEKAKEFIESQRKAAEDAKSEEQKRLDAITARETAATQAVAEAATATRNARISSALAELGATGENLRDAAVLLAARVTADADEAAIREAAGKLKEARADFFDPTKSPTPAPSSVPAPTPPPAPTTGEFGAQGLEEAKRRFPDRFKATA